MGFPARPPSTAVFNSQMFQSLIGFYGFSGGLAPLSRKCDRLGFQSLIGFYGFSGALIFAMFILGLQVSIPDRVLWVFRPLAFQTVAVFSIQGSFASAQTKNTISASVCQYPTLTCRLKLLLDKGFSNCVCLLFPVGASNPYSS